MNKVKFKYVSLFAIVGFAAALLYGLSRVLAATSPTLGTASSFAILAGTPNITNVPTSAITGDVGLSPATGAAIGLTCLEVTGTIYQVDAAGPLCFVTNPGLLTTAKADLVTAFNNLSASPNDVCTTNYGAVTQELSGLTLVPGVYCANAFQLSGPTFLTLDDTGAPNGVWIFRADLSTLNTTPGVGGKVQFLNGIGSSCNVWWKVASSATIGSSATFIGNILALTDISLGTGATLNGRALARNGAVTLDQNTINASACQVTTTTTIGPTTTTIGPTTTTIGPTTTTIQPGSTTTTTLPPGATIPAAGNWGMVILGLAFLGAIAWMVRARRSLR
jgi:hypothetical protein